MTDRIPLDHLTSNALDQLYDRLDWIQDAAALHRQGLIRTSELYATIEAADEIVPAATAPCTAGYCPACGRGDVAPTPAEYEQQRQRADQAEAKVADYENRITWHTTCGSCARTLDSSIRETERAERAEAAVARVRAAVHIADDQDVTDWQRGYRACAERALAALYQPAPASSEKSAAWFAAHSQPAPAATQATEQQTTAHVLSALHQSAEEDVTRVITLYEQWVKAGPPPIGASIARWWDARLAELHNAILPPTA